MTCRGRSHIEAIQRYEVTDMSERAVGRRKGVGAGTEIVRKVPGRIIGLGKVGRAGMLALRGGMRSV